jgi:hypothetical protein
VKKKKRKIKILYLNPRFYNLNKNRKEFDSIIPKLESETRNLKGKLELKTSLNNFEANNLSTTNTNTEIQKFFNLFSSPSSSAASSAITPLRPLKLNQQNTRTPKQQNYLFLLNESFNKENSFNDQTLFDNRTYIL